MWLKLWSWFRIFREDLLVLLLAMRHPATPNYVKTLLLAAFIYLLSPFDILPDALPVVGWLDDVVIVPAAVCGLINLLPANVRRESEARADQLAKRMPYLLFALAVVVFLWVMFFIWAVYSLLLR